MTHKIGFFDLADKIMQALIAGDYVADDAPDCRAQDKNGNIVVSASLPNEDFLMQHVTAIVSTSILRTLPNDILDKCPEMYDFSITHYKGDACFYFKSPHDIDFVSAQRHLEGMKNLLCERFIMPEISSPSSEISIGPINHEQFGLFRAIIDQIVLFNGDIQNSSLEFDRRDTDMGYMMVFDRAEYLRLFANEENFSPTLLPDDPMAFAVPFSADDGPLH